MAPDDPCRRPPGLLLACLALLLTTAVARGQLVVDFSADVTQGRTPLAVQFTDLTTGVSPLSWTWNFGDGTFSHDQHPLHTYLDPGLYSVQLIVVPQAGDAMLLLKPDLIDVTAGPLTAAFSADPLIGPTPLTVAFENLSSGGATGFLWDFGDGTSSTAASPTKVFTTGATTASFDISLTVSGPGGVIDSVLLPDLIQVTPLLDAAFSVSGTRGLWQVTSELIDQTAVFVPDAWTWDLGDGTSADTASVLHTYESADQPRFFDVSLGVTAGGQGAAVTLEDAIGVAPARLHQSRKIGDPANQDFAIATLDLDLDGNIDLLVGGYPHVLGYRQKSSANLFFGGIAVTALPGTHRALAVGDVNGDGLDDMYTGTSDTNAVTFWRPGTGLGNLGQIQFVTQGPRDARAVELADVDDDGDLDVFIAKHLSLSLLENDGAGTFTPVAAGFSGAPAIPLPLDLRAADLDGDGDVDLAIRPTEALPVGWFGQTAGQFAWVAAGSPGPAPASYQDVDVGDLDLDGELDLVLAQPLVPPVMSELWWHPGDGQGGLATPGLIAPVELQSELVVDDLDGDGDPDVVVGRLLPDSLLWFETLASGWEQRFLPELSGGVPAIALTDIDSDGDSDVVTLHGDQLVWVPNTVRSTGWAFAGPGLAVGGVTPVLHGAGSLTGDKLVSLTLSSARPGANTTLVLGLMALGAPFKGGVLGPQPDVLISGLPVDGAGRQVVVTRWPQGVPGGLTLFAQHWVSDPDGPVGLSASNTLRATTH